MNNITPPQPPTATPHITPLAAPQTQQAVKSAEKSDPTYKDPKKKRQPQRQKDDSKTLDIEV